MSADPLAHLRGRPFSTHEAHVAGAGRARTDARRLDRPFAAVRAFERPATVVELCDAYRVRMAAHEFFSHRTAAVLHGMWLPLHHERRLLLDVAVVKPQRAPRDARVRGHHLVDRPSLVWTVDGRRVANPLETFCQLATVLDGDDLVVAAERLLPPHEPSSLVMLDRMVGAAADPVRPAHRRLELAVARIRVGSRSAQETRLRLRLVAAGLPEPLLNHRPADRGPEWIEGDLVYPDRRIWIEVEGDHHRTDRTQWRNDVVRYERLTDAGWRVIRVTADDIDGRIEETVARIARARSRAA